MRYRLAWVSALVLLAVCPRGAEAQTTFTVTNEADLRAALVASASGDTIQLAGNITLTQDLPPIVVPLTFDGGDFTLSGGGQYRGLVVFNDSLITPFPVTIANLTIADTVATGGAGGDGSLGGGGGGGGLGGAIHVSYRTEVTISNITIVDSSAVGGDGGQAVGPGAGGGGGMGGAGGTPTSTGGGGGGGFGAGATGGDIGMDGGAGAATNLSGGGGGADALGGFGGDAGGGGGGGDVAGGGGGIGGSFGNAVNGGGSGFGGGGGGAASVPFAFGGSGGVGGGGGGGTDGGGGSTYGGGGGGSTTGAPTTANVNGGGGAGLDGGGGGAGLGGAIFVDEGATLTIGGNVTIAGNAVDGGHGGGNAEDGAAAGSGIWLAGAGTLRLNAAAGQTITIADEIADSRGTGILEYDSSLEAQTTRPWGLQKDGEGRLVLSADNRYAGGTSIVAGTLSVARDSNLGTIDPSLISDAAVRIGDAATLEITESGTFARPMAVYGDASVSVLAGRSVTWAGDVLDNDLGGLHVTGGGTLELQGVGTYQLGTRVTGNSTLRVSADASLGSFGTPVTLGDATTHGTLSFTGNGTILSGRSVQLDIGGGTIDVQGTTEVELVSTGGVTGSGDFHKTGTGLLSLGSATHNGGTFIEGGTLRMNLANAFLPTSAITVASGATFDLEDNDQAIGSLAGAGTVELGSATLDTGADNANTAFSGTIAGVGQLIKRGTGSFTLTGTNSYSGGTSLLSGELRVHAGSLPGDILNDGSLVFDQVDTGTYSGAISGSGSLVKLGAGALTLAGTATHSGGTTILEGALIGTTSNLTGSIANAATLVFDQASSGSYAGALSGAGQLVKRGTGTVTFASAQPFFTGATVVEGGTLALGTNQVFAPTNAIAIASGATLNLSGTTQAFGALGGSGTVAIGTGMLTLGQGNVSSIFAGQLTGTGSLVKTGTGSLALTGSSAFTGVTTVAAGSLVGTSASLGPTIVNNATLVFDQASSGTYAGTISGNGVLVKTGDGTLRLAGSATHTGGTQILGGTLAGDSSTLTGTFLNQATIQFDQGGSGTFAGTIVGSGRLVKDGGGTLVLAGPNAYTGGTVVNAGMLVGNTESLRGDITNHAAVVFDQAGNGTYAGSMQGGGSLTKTGGGALALTGSNSYTGGTFVEGGTLIGSSTSLGGAITNQARVVFDQGTDGLFTGTMTGSGVFEKAGAGTLTVTGRLGNTGGTFVSGGTLAGSPEALRGLFLTTGTLAFTGTKDGTFEGSLFGNGGLLKVGSHTLTLIGEQPFNGTTTVREGTLVLDGTLGGDVFVEAGGTLRATGAIAGSLNLGGALLLDADGVSAPASTSSAWPFAVPFRQMLASATGTPPILTVGRDMTATPGSTLTMGIGSPAAPSLLVDGSAALDHLALSIDAPTMGSDRSVSFLALGARNGLSFNDATITTNNDRILPRLTRRDNALLVTLLNLDAPLSRPNTDPQLNEVGKALEGLTRNPTGDRGVVLTELLALDDDGFRNALDQISGEVHSSSRVLGVRGTEAFTDMVRNNLLDRDIEGDVESGGGATTGWGGEFVRWWGRFSTERTSYSPSTGALSGEALLQDAGYGFDLRISDQWLIGGGGGFGLGSLTLDSFGSRSESRTPRGFGTLGWKPKSLKGISVRAGGSVARMSSDSQRQLLIVAMLPDELGGGALTGGIERLPTSEEVTTLTDQWTEVADRFHVKGYRFDVLVGVRRSTFSREAFTEVGAGALSLSAIAETLTLKDIDVKLHTLRRKGSWRPYGEMLVRRSSDWPMWTRMTLAGADAADVSEFEVRGLPLGNSSYAGRLGLMAVRRIGTLTAEYRFRKAAGQLSQAFDLRFRF